VFDKLLLQEQDLERQLQVKRQMPVRDDAAEVDAAMGVLDRMTSLASDQNNLAAIGSLFTGVNARLFLRFTEVSWGNRKVNRVAGEW